MEFTEQEIAEREQLDAVQEEYEAWQDFKVTLRVANRITPTMLAQLQDDELVIVPARMVRKAA